jgi:diguanylate cyclase (GGDEF)-like protein
MPDSGSDKQNLRDSLIRQGVPQEDIQKLYRSLRDKGYGEEEARRRSKATYEKLRAEKMLAERRRNAQAPARTPAEQGTAAHRPPAEKSASGRRAVDWVPEVPLFLRRRINRYAFRRSFLATGVAERFDDFMCTFDKTRGDYASRALLRYLADEKGWKGSNPYRLSFVDCLDALRDSARRILGTTEAGSRARSGDGAAEALGALRSREPFAVEFFSVFTEPYDMLRRSLEYLGTAYRAGRRVKVTELARVVKDGCRLVAVTEHLERDKLEMLIEIAREVNAERAPGGRAAAAFADAEGLFRACYQALPTLQHELYPPLLKMIGAFYEEESADPKKRSAITAFLGVREEDILTWEGWQKRQRERRERELAEQQARELARLEAEKAGSIGVKFEGTLATMSSLFPESGIERIEQGAFVLPYFANRVFGHAPLYQSRQLDLEQLSSDDPMGLIMVVHSLIDDLLGAVDAFALEKVVRRDGLAAEFSALRESWREAYPRLFEPYLDAIKDWARETGRDVRSTQVFRESAHARGLEERINQLRNKAIRNFGHLISDRERIDAPALYDLAIHAAALLTEAGGVVNQATVTADDPVARRAREDLVASVVADLQAPGAGSFDYRPVTRQVRRWVEARFREPVTDVPVKAQVAFMDVLRGLVYLDESLLNDPQSPAARASHAVTTASDEDRAAWTRERSERGRDSLSTLQASLREQFPGQFVDALTGLRNKDFFINELPRTLEKLRARKGPLTLLMMDIDHFKWVNDELGHARGDEVLKATAAMILDNIREGDLAVRYGGEEMLILIPSDLHTGIVLAERLRHSQENRVLAREAMADVRRVAEAGGQPCGTLSIGVADVVAVPELTRAVEKGDRALYAAKRTRNAVVYIDPAREKKGQEAFATYADYYRQADYHRQAEATRRTGGGA